MSWRAVHDHMALSESLSQLSDFAERLWVRMLANSDSWGRLQGDPFKVRMLCCPALPKTVSDVADALDEMETVGRIKRYIVSEVVYVEITDFDQNQPRDVKGRDGDRYKSRFPSPSEATAEWRGVARSNSAERGEDPRSAAVLRVARPDIENEIESESEKGQDPYFKTKDLLVTDEVLGA